MTSLQLPPAPNRPPDAHKGTFGTVLIIGGSETMLGAPALTATAALKSGAGLTKIATHRNILPHCLTIQPSATGLILPDHNDPHAVDAFIEHLAPNTIIAAGPGFAVGKSQAAWIQTLLQAPHPLVLDADGLNNLTILPPSIISQIAAPLILTPHPGEFARLAATFDITADPTNPDTRPDAALQLAQKFNATVILKGQHSIIAHQDQTYTNQTGNPALATAGSGDILTGIIAAFLAQNLSPSNAATLAAHIHGLAADIYAQTHGPSGLTALQLADLIPTALHQHYINQNP